MKVLGPPGWGTLPAYNHPQCEFDLESNFCSKEIKESPPPSLSSPGSPLSLSPSNFDRTGPDEIKPSRDPRAISFKGSHWQQTSCGISQCFWGTIPDITAAMTQLPFCFTFSMILQSQPQPNCFSPASCSSQKEYLQSYFPFVLYVSPTPTPSPPWLALCPALWAVAPSLFPTRASFMKDIFSMDGGGG